MHILFPPKRKRKPLSGLVQTGNALAALCSDLNFLSQIYWYLARLSGIFDGPATSPDPIPRGKRIEVPLSSLTLTFIVAVDN